MNTDYINGIPIQQTKDINTYSDSVYIHKDGGHYKVLKITKYKLYNNYLVNLIEYKKNR